MHTVALDRLYLEAGSAAELMTPNPVSVHQDAALGDAIALFTDRELGAAPVIDDAGRPVGVVSRTDIIRRIGRNGSPEGGSLTRAVPDGSSPAATKAIDLTPVREIMTPAVLSVPPSASALEVVAMLLGVGRVHQLFVIDETGVLVGVISAMDVLRKLKRESR
jgi:CBS domain-containing protein